MCPVTVRVSLNVNAVILISVENTVLTALLFSEPEKAGHFVPEAYEPGCTDGSRASFLQLGEPQP